MCSAAHEIFSGRPLIIDRNQHYRLPQRCDALVMVLGEEALMAGEAASNDLILIEATQQLPRGSPLPDHMNCFVALNRSPSRLST